MGFEGKSVLITGAGSGLGRQAALRFAEEGAHLVLGDVAEAGLAETAAMVRTAGADFRALRCDVNDAGDAAALVSAAVESFGRLDIAVNNAGILHRLARLPDLETEVFERVMAVNAGGVFLGMKHQLPVMIGQRAGVIVNIASAAGLVGAPLMSAYAAAKHAVIGLTRSAADECARAGVRINALCPSFAATPMLDDIADEMGSDEVEERLTTRVPMRRFARPEEVVAALLFLASDDNSFMTGQALSVDGGLTAV